MKVKEDLQTEDYLQRIEIKESVMRGKAVIWGTRITTRVDDAIQGISEREILKQYPRLILEDIQAGLAYASAVISEDIYPISIQTT